MLTVMLALSVAAAALAAPDPTHTPGMVRPLTQDAVCSVRWGTDARKVTPAMKRRIFEWYGIPQAERKNYEVDHLVPRSAGGADDVANLWPQPWVPDARLKDRLETKLHKLVCITRELSLQDAQSMFLQDWQRGYRQYIGPLP